MSDSVIIQAKQSNTTENYAVYDSPDGGDEQQLVGTYVFDEVADNLGEYVEFNLSTDFDDGLALTRDKNTSSYAVFSSESDIIEAAYISFEVLKNINFNEDKTVYMVARPSSQEAFEAALNEQSVTVEDEQEEIAALLGTPESASDESPVSDTAGTTLDAQHTTDD